MNTFQLSCFLAVAEHLNFTRAAEQLHVTHPSVSQQIQSLEKELNVKLFQRSTRSVKLTEEGIAFLQDAQQIVAISERAKKRYSSSTPKDLELLSLGCYNFPCMFSLLEPLKMLRTLHPTLHPMLRVIPFQHIYRMLEEGDLDGVVSFKEPNSAKISAVYKEIVRSPWICLCSRENPLSKQDHVTFNDLKKEQVVLFAPPKASAPIARLQGKLIGDRSLSEVYFCESTESIALLVAAQYGITILPDFLTPEISSVAKIPLVDAEPQSFGIYYKSLQGKPVLKDFIQCSKEWFSKPHPSAQQSEPHT